MQYNQQQIKKMQYNKSATSSNKRFQYQERDLRDQLPMELTDTSKYEKSNKFIETRQKSNESRQNDIEILTSMLNKQ